METGGLRRLGLIFLLCVLFLTPARAGQAQDHVFVGMQVQELSVAAARALGLMAPRGVLVRDVSLGGPADQAGFTRGDLILSLAGEPVEGLEHLLALTSRLAPGTAVAARVRRYGGEVDLFLEPGNWPAAWTVTEDSFASLNEAGFTVSAITPKVRERFNLRWGTVGVVVSFIAPDRGGTLGLDAGDVIVQVDQEPVWAPSRVNEILQQARDAKKKAVLLLVEAADGFRFILLPVAAG